MPPPFGNSSSLLTVDEFNRGKLSFQEPLSELCKSTWGRKSSSMSLDLLGFRLLVVSEDFAVRRLTVRRNASKNVEVEEEVLQPTPSGNEPSAKAVVLSNPSPHAMVLYQEGMVGVLGLEPHIEWKLMPDPGPGALQYDDIVKLTSKNLIFGVSSNGTAHLITFNHGTCSLDQIAITSPIADASLKRKRLVVDSSNDILFLVEAHHQGLKLVFNVYKLEIKLQNWEQGLQTWERVMNLDDQIFFMDVDFSFCAAAWDFDGLTKAVFGDMNLIWNRNLSSQVQAPI